MNADRYANYLRRVNAQDPIAFDAYLPPDLLYVNGALEFRGVDAMKAHCAGVWRRFTQTDHALRVVMDDQSLGGLIWTILTHCATIPML